MSSERLRVGWGAARYSRFGGILTLPGLIQLGQPVSRPSTFKGALPLLSFSTLAEDSFRFDWISLGRGSNQPLDQKRVEFIQPVLSSRAMATASSEYLRLLQLAAPRPTPEPKRSKAL